MNAAANARAIVAAFFVTAAWFLGGIPEAYAHDFWIEPERFATEVREPITLGFLVGHGNDRQRSQIPMRRIVRLEAFSPLGVRENLRPRLVQEGEYLALNIALDPPGAHVIVLETDNSAQSRLPATRFNEYAQAEGLSLVLARREREGEEGRDGSEIYRRCAKAIVNVSGDGGGRAITRVYGLTLEIVPDRILSDEVSARVLFHGRPLSGALVKLTDLAQDEMPAASAITDGAGRIDFVLPRESRWLLNVVWSTPRGVGSSTDFETYFSSLSFAA